MEGKQNDYNLLKQKIFRTCRKERKNLVENCRAFDDNQSGYIHRAPLKVILETLIHPMSAEMYLRLIRPFESSQGSMVDYRRMVACFTASGAV